MTSASPQVIEDLVNIKFQTDVRIFTVMAALNLAGFDIDADDLAHNPVRQLVRERLAVVSPDLRERLQQYYAAHGAGMGNSGMQGNYVSYALLLNGPPQFTLISNPAGLPAEVIPLVGFESLLQELWKQGNLAVLWDEVRPQYVHEAEAYRPQLRDMIIGTLRYMRTEPRVALDRKVVFIPDLLNGYGIVNARNIANDYVIVVGPRRPGEMPMRPLRHEYLHFLVDPLVAKYFASLPPAAPYLRKADEQPRVRESIKNDFVLLTAESLIQALEMRLDRESADALSKEMIDAYEQGLILTPYFEQKLRSFEERQDSFQQFYPAMIQGISWETESGRGTDIARLKKEIKSRGEPGPSQQPEVRSLLIQANRFLAVRDFDGATPLLERVLQIDPLNASALFGTAQIAAQAQDFDRALALYEKAAANAGADVWIAAWSWVRRGNIFQFLGDAGKAKAEWSKVLALQGDLHGAAEAAAKALSP